MQPPCKKSENNNLKDFEAEQLLLKMIRNSLAKGVEIAFVPQNLSFEFQKKISQLFITLFQEGKKPIRWGSRRATLAESINSVIKKLRQNEKFGDFSISNPSACRILFEVVTEKKRCDPKRTTTLNLTDNRLEPGINGLTFNWNGRTIYYMPTDAYVKSQMTMPQVYNHLARRIGLIPEIKSKKERASIVRNLPTAFYRIQSKAFVTYKKNTLPLYRGLPAPPKLTKKIIHNCIIKGADWIVTNQKENGKFLYYYDASTGSTQDFQHPNTDYYNILRHAGGTITLLQVYGLTNDVKYLAAARKSVEFLVSTFRYHQVNNDIACYPFFNKKSKLGGAGIALVALLRYLQATSDTAYEKETRGLICHILSRIAEDGEMTGYFIHPLYNDGKELVAPSETMKADLFSFYYPGEALLGLVLALQLMNTLEPTLRARINEKCELAFDFLIEKRPVKYSHLFQTLPSDGWLMQAVESWILTGGKAKQSYIDFVHNDGLGMITHMYKADNAPYPDYPGMFYYTYGEHAYPDGARSEGLIAAYSLARFQRDDEKTDTYLPYLKMAAQALLYTFNSEEASYAHRYPSESRGSFRFKLTRQWVRIDSAQHAICFFTRLLPYLK